MRLHSIIRLLKAGQLLFQNQQELKVKYGANLEGVNYAIQIIQEVILIHTGILQMRKNMPIIMNTDHYELLAKKLEQFNRKEISLKSICHYIQALTLNQMMRPKQSTMIVNKLFELKYLLQIKRHQLIHLLHCKETCIRIEKDIIKIALQELDGKRYFNENHDYPPNEQKTPS